ncbi:PDZ and LIM domain protein 3 isoform X7 [Topomyia yanbarensis]|uniref:PDZ and LIM domain protein 3 isoform X7 n=1 Tax=Topomyia yanbarensis TaxID=2498891 RepID=UPI00273BC330|nr:PDZ and LIM domain protein 3 isoform X7 [Topomyia yanbarensis]
MSPKPHDFLVTLRRKSPQIPWGIRLVGGTDLNAPLIITRVQVNSPAQKELLRGDIITKIDQYDARDLMHSDAQNLFRNAGGEIKVTIRRDDQVALHQSAHQPNGVGASPYSPALSPIPPAQSAQPFKPYNESAQHDQLHQQKPQQHQNFPPPEPSQLLPRVNSPLPHGPHAYATALEHPMETLPHTIFPNLDATGAYQLPRSPYPQAASNYEDSNESITNQIVHKQFNSPIGLYSDNNIENTLRHSAQQQNQAVPIFIDLSFLKQKQKILEEQRRLGQENQLKNKYPFQSYASSSSLHSCTSGHSSPSPYAMQQQQQSRQSTLSPPPVPPLPGDYYHQQQQQHSHN